MLPDEMEKLSYYDTLRNCLGFEAERFKNPDNCFWPVYFWIWNAALDGEEIKKQIDEMYEADIRGFCIIPIPPEFRPDSMVTELAPPYLSDEFMEFVKLAADYAASKDMVMWLYDEGGWPSGGACGLVVKALPEMGRKQLKVRKVCLPCGQKYKMPEECKAAFVGDERINDGFLADADMEISEYCLRIVSDFFSDVSEPEGVEMFLKLTHDRYREYLGEHMGKTIPLMFTDEPLNPCPSFCYGFEEKFREKYGYDILDFLPVLFKNAGENDEENKIRTDYFRLCGELLRENLHKRQYEWCEKNGIMAGGHLDGDHDPRRSQMLGRTNTVDFLGEMAIPGIDVIWRQIMPDGKAEDVGVPFFPRDASSAAHKNGTNLALSESFAVYGSGLTMDEMRYVVNAQLVRGINVHSFMLISYGRDRFLAFTERPSFGKEKPGYSNLTVINSYTARASYLNTIGESCIDTALYLPQNDLYAGGEIAEKAYCSFRELGMALEKQGIEFDIIEDYGIEAAVCQKDSLLVGNARYRHIYIPSNRYMPETVKEKLTPYMADAEPVCKSTGGFEALRVAKRRLPDGGEVYFFYNEGNTVLETEISISSAGEYLYELSMMSGEIYQIEYCSREGENIFKLSLESGESKAFLSTSQVYETSADPWKKAYENIMELKNFSAAKVSEFVLDRTGGYKKSYQPSFAPMELGSWKAVFGEAFSGDVSYRTSIVLDSKPSGKVLLELGKVQYSACVYVNGKYAGTAGVYPMAVSFDGDLLEAGDNVIEIVVSNTAANQFVLSKVDELFEKKEIGDYNDPAKSFEKEHLDGGLYGPVVIRY